MESLVAIPQEGGIPPRPLTCFDRAAIASAHLAAPSSCLPPSQPPEACRTRSSGRTLPVRSAEWPGPLPVSAPGDSRPVLSGSYLFFCGIRHYPTHFSSISECFFVALRPECHKVSRCSTELFHSFDDSGQRFGVPRGPAPLCLDSS